MGIGYGRYIYQYIYQTFLSWHKAIRLHLLRHVVECIRMYGSAVNFHGAIGESHLNNKANSQPGELE